MWNRTLFMQLKKLQNTGNFLQEVFKAAYSQLRMEYQYLYVSIQQPTR